MSVLTARQRSHLTAVLSRSYLEVLDVIIEQQELLTHAQIEYFIPATKIMGAPQFVDALVRAEITQAFVRYCMEEAGLLGLLQGIELEDYLANTCSVEEPVENPVIRGNLYRIDAETVDLQIPKNDISERATNESSDRNDVEMIESDSNCVVCTEQPLETILPCGHVTMCRTCVQMTTSCPLCRTEFNQDSVKRAYLP